MKAIITGALILLLLPLKAQVMTTPNDAVIQLFVNTDHRNWEQVEALFDDEVLLDYSSMSGSPAATLTPNQITTAWKGILPGFESTHHQIGNILSETSGNKAHVFCYGTATHFLTDDNGNIWTVVGSYDFDLRKTSEGAWKVSSMTFNFKYQDGNTALPEKAINKLK